MKVLRIQFFLALFCITYCSAQAPKYSNEFLSIGVGARALGMSNAAVAISNDVNAIYWNPAGILNSKNKYEVGLMHSEHMAGIAKYDFAGFVTPIDVRSQLGLSVIRFGVDDIPNTLDLVDNSGQINYDRIKSFAAADYAFLFTYAFRSNIVEELNFGINAKVINRVVGNFATAWGFGGDASAQYYGKNIKLGVMIRDVTTTYNVWSFNTVNLQRWTQLNNELPETSIEVTLPKLLLGTAYNLTILKDFSFLISVDFDASFDGKRNALVSTDFISLDPHGGIELGYGDLVFLRGGVNNIQDSKAFDGTPFKTYSPSAGLGVKIGMVAIDYALTALLIDSFSESLKTHVFSLRVDLKK